MRRLFTSNGGPSAGQPCAVSFRSEMERGGHVRKCRETRFHAACRCQLPMLCNSVSSSPSRGLLAARQSRRPASRLPGQLKLLEMLEHLCWPQLVCKFGTRRPPLEALLHELLAEALALRPILWNVWPHWRGPPQRCSGSARCGSADR